MNYLTNILAIFILLVTSSVYALSQDEEAYTQAIQLGQENNSYVLLVFSTNGCRYCKMLEDGTFNDPYVAATNKQYVVLKINISRQGSSLYRRFQQKYNSNTDFGRIWSGKVPVYFLINPHQFRCIRKGIGYKDKNQYIEWLRNGNY